MKNYLVIWLSALREHDVQRGEDLQDIVSKAMRKAWQLGQTYWQQADSEYVSHNKKASETQCKFDDLINATKAEIRAQG